MVISIKTHKNVLVLNDDDYDDDKKFTLIKEQWKKVLNAVIEYRASNFTLGSVIV